MTPRPGRMNGSMMQVPSAYKSVCQARFEIDLDLGTYSSCIAGVEGGLGQILDPTKLVPRKGKEQVPKSAELEDSLGD